MKKTLYSFLALGAVLLATPAFAHATATAGTLEIVNLEARGPVTTPAKLNRQLHKIQNQLKAKAKHQARANRRRYQSGAIG